MSDSAIPVGYVPQEFPKMKYGPNGEQKVVEDAKAEKALKGWADYPDEPPPPDEVKPFQPSLTVDPVQTPDPPKQPGGNS